MIILYFEFLNILYQRYEYKTTAEIVKFSLCINKEKKKDIRGIKTDYTPKTEFKEAVKEFRNDLKEAQKQFLTKEDFIREQRKTENKLDEIYKLLLKERA